MFSTNIKKRHFLPENKFKILQEVSAYCSVSHVCMANEISRSTYYKWKKQYEADKEAGLNRTKRLVSNHPSETKKEVVDQVIEFSIAHAEVGCCKIADELLTTGIKISSPTIQKILVKERLGKKEQRLRTLEKLHMLKGWSISLIQTESISKINPAFKHRSEIGSYPGEILVQDTFPIFDILPDHYLYVVIDTYSFYTFTYPIKEKTADMAIDLLRVKVFRFFSAKNLVIKKIMTSRGREFTQFNNRYTLFLNGRQITHEVYAGKEKNWHGFIERYKKETQQQLRQLNIKNFEDSKQLNKKLNNDKKNAEKRVDGFPNFGASPLSIIKSYQEKVKTK